MMAHPPGRQGEEDNKTTPSRPPRNHIAGPDSKSFRRRMASTGGGAGEGNKMAAGSSLHTKTLLKSQSLYQVTHPKHHAMFHNLSSRPIRATPIDYLASLLRLVHTGIHRVPSRAGLPAGAPRRHRHPPHVSHVPGSACCSFRALVCGRSSASSCTVGV